MILARIYLGIGQDRNGEPITDGHILLHAAEQLLTKSFGGVTSYKAGGGWWHDEKKIMVDEKTCVFEVLINPERKSQFRVAATIIGKKFNQACVLLTFHGETFEHEMRDIPR